jgi:hypothetical protein
MLDASAATRIRGRGARTRPGQERDRDRSLFERRQREVRRRSNRPSFPKAIIAAHERVYKRKVRYLNLKTPVGRD